MITTSLRSMLAGLSLAALLVLAACGEPPPTPTPALPAATATAPPVQAPTDTAAPVPPTTAPTDTAPAPTDTAPPPTRTAAPVPTRTTPPPPPTRTSAPPPATATQAPAAWQLVSTAVQDSRAALVHRAGAPGAVYAGGNGVYRSADAGRGWVALTTDVKAQFVVVAPSDPRVIYAGTGEGCASGQPGSLARSTDGGTTWKTLPAGPYALTVDPGDPNSLIGLRCAGVYHSADGAKTWQKLPGTHDTNYDAFLLTRGVNDPATLYAVYVSEGGTPLVQRSTDTGQTWKTLPQPGQSAPRDLAVDPKDAKHVYFLGSGGFMSSADGGQTWNAHNGGLPASGGSYDLSNLAIDTVSAPPAGATATLYVSAGGLPNGAPAGVLRWNGNDAWVPFAPAPHGKAIYRLLAVNDPDAPALLALTDDGLYRFALR